MNRHDFDSTEEARATVERLTAERVELHVRKLIPFAKLNRLTVRAITDHVADRMVLDMGAFILGSCKQEVVASVTVTTNDWQRFKQYLARRLHHVACRVGGECRAILVQRWDMESASELTRLLRFRAWLHGKAVGFLTRRGMEHRPNWERWLRVRTRTVTNSAKFHTRVCPHVHAPDHDLVVHFTWLNSPDILDSGGANPRPFKDPAMQALPLGEPVDELEGPPRVTHED